MKNSSKNGKQALATLLLFFGLLVFGFSTPSTPLDCNCSTPSVTITGQTSNSVSFSWGAVSGASGYLIWYVRGEDNYTSTQTSTGGTTISYSSLPKGTYKFYFSTDCGGSVSQIIITDDLLMD